MVDESGDPSIEFESRANDLSNRNRESAEVRNKALNSQTSIINVPLDDGQSDTYNKQALTRQFRRKGISVKNDLVIQKDRASKSDLVPKKNKNHHLDGIDKYLCTVFDNYAQEYGEFFQDEVTRLEERVEQIKREIHLSTMEKNPHTSMNVTMMTNNVSMAHPDDPFT